MVVFLHLILYHQVDNKVAKKKGLEHWILLVSTHNYLVEGYYLDQLLETHRTNMEKFIDKVDKYDKKTNKKHKSKVVVKEVVKPFVIKSKHKDKPDIEISSNRFPLTSANVKDRKNLE
jgi:hypothetical protein